MCASCEERGIGELYVAGDQACEQGELVTLAQIAEHLSEHLSEHIAEPLHCELVALARKCTDPKLASGAWDQLKRRLRFATVHP